MKNNWKKIGIIGGAGPAAGALLYQIIIEQCQRDYACKNDEDFPEIILLSYPFSQMIDLEQGKKNRDILTRELTHCVNSLLAQRCNRIGIACNTLHAYLSNSLHEKTIIRIDTTVKKTLVKNSAKRVLMLGTKTMLQADLYASADYKIVAPRQLIQNKINTTIGEVLKGRITNELAIELGNLIKTEKQITAADTVLLACTELSVLAHIFPLTLATPDIIDTLPLLATALLKKKRTS